MLPRAKISFLIVVLVLVCSFSGSHGTNESTVNHISPHFKVLLQARKLLGSVDVLDYHDPGANPSHDPGKGKGGPGAQH